MTKTELVAEIATLTEKTKKETAETLDATLKVITDTLARGEKIQLVGFGTFETKEVAERTARNPQDGTELVVPAHKKIGFKAGKALKTAVNE